MLRLKENVDITILEKYGFEDNSNGMHFPEDAYKIGKPYLYSKSYEDYSIDVYGFKWKNPDIEDDFSQIIIDPYLCGFDVTPDFYIEELDTLYDLIKDGLVEKIEVK